VTVTIRRRGADADRTHHVLLYDYVPDVLERRAPHREAHWRGSMTGARGARVAAGAVGDRRAGRPSCSGDDPAEIDDYVAGDPYVIAGLVTVAGRPVGGGDHRPLTGSGRCGWDIVAA